MVAAVERGTKRSEVVEAFAVSLPTIKRWLKQRRYASLRLITSDWHMRRARYEFRKVLGPEYRIVPDAVRTEPPFTTLRGTANCGCPGILQC